MYTCESASSVDPMYVLIGFLVLALIGAAAGVGFSVGKKKGAESLQQNAYGAYGANNTNMAYAGKPTYANPSYGNPFAQTA